MIRVTGAQNKTARRLPFMVCLDGGESTGIPSTTSAERHDVVCTELLRWASGTWSSGTPFLAVARSSSSIENSAGEDVSLTPSAPAVESHAAIGAYPRCASALPFTPDPVLTVQSIGPWFVATAWSRPVRRCNISRRIWKVSIEPSLGGPAPPPPPMQAASPRAGQGTYVPCVPRFLHSLAGLCISQIWRVGTDATLSWYSPSAWGRLHNDGALCSIKSRSLLPRRPRLLPKPPPKKSSHGVAVRARS